MEERYERGLTVRPLRAGIAALVAIATVGAVGCARSAPPPPKVLPDAGVGPEEVLLGASLRLVQAELSVAVELAGRGSSGDVAWHIEQARALVGNAYSVLAPSIPPEGGDSREPGVTAGGASSESPPTEESPPARGGPPVAQGDTASRDGAGGSSTPSVGPRPGGGFPPLDSLAKLVEDIASETSGTRTDVARLLVTVREAVGNIEQRTLEQRANSATYQASVMAAIADAVRDAYEHSAAPGIDASTAVRWRQSAFGRLSVLRALFVGPVSASLGAEDPEGSQAVSEALDLAGKLLPQLGAAGEPGMAGEPRVEEMNGAVAKLKSALQRGAGAIEVDLAPLLARR